MRDSKNFWDRMAKNYDGGDKKQDKIHLMTVEHTLQYLKSSDTVLDFACATGQYSREIANSVKEIHAIDFSSKMIEVAKTKLVDNNINNIHFATSTLFDDRLKGESFNVILGFNIIHLLEDYKKSIQRINHLLKPGGLFITASPCMGEELSFIRVILSMLGKIGLTPHINFFKKSELRQQMMNENFEIIEFKDFNKSAQNHFVVAKKV